MSGAPSISTRRAYGVQRICRVWERARSSVYARRHATRARAPRCRRGPVGAAPDAVLVGHIRRVLQTSPFHGEGDRKAWAKLRVAGIVVVNVRVDRVGEVADAQKVAAPNLFRGQVRKPHLDEIQPRGARGHKVQIEPRMPAEPPLNRRRLVRRVVIDDRVDRHVRRRFRVEQVQELTKFLMTMARQARADDGAFEDIQRGKQGGRAVPFVVVGHRAGPAGLHRQARLRPLQRLDLALFVDTEDQGLLRRIHIESDDVGELLQEPRVRRQLERADAVRLQAWPCQIR